MTGALQPADAQVMSFDHVCSQKYEGGAVNRPRRW